MKEDKENSSKESIGEDQKSLGSGRGFMATVYDAVNNVFERLGYPRMDVHEIKDMAELEQKLATQEKDEIEANGHQWEKKDEEPPSN